MIRFLVIVRNLPAIQQLRQGLQTFGLLEMMQNYQTQFKEVFCKGTSELLTAEQMEAIFQKIVFSENGSNRRREEERTVSYWRDYLIDIQERNVAVTFEDLLVFATGTNQVPYMGFLPDPSIEFEHGKKTRNFVQANTCAMVLRLPIVDTYDSFKDNMDFGILNSPGFGMA